MKREAAKRQTEQPATEGEPPRATDSGPDQGSMRLGVSRRQVLAGAGAGLGVAVLAGAGMASPARAAVRGMSAAGAPQPAPGARSLDFDLDWKFALVNTEGITDPTGAYTDAYEPSFNDSGWELLNVPHDWSVYLSPVEASYTYSGNGFFPGGLGWYRKTFTLPTWMTGKRISIEFDGVYMNSNVYANGQLLGNHPYAYTGFNYDLTGIVHTDGTTPNVIAVQATNQIPSSRWYSGSGIYRNVHIIVTDPVHVARHGTFVTTPNLGTTITSRYGNAQVATDVQNNGTGAADVTVSLTISDPRGSVVARGSSSISVPAGQQQTTTSVLKVGNPSLWSPDNPALYSVETAVLSDGQVVDTTTTPFGFRYCTFDPDKGFSLNGQYLKIQGVDLHATQGPLGAAIHTDSITRQMQLMKSYGANWVKTAHNPPAPELITVCEQLGIMLEVEAFDCWATGKLPYDYHLYFDQWGVSDIQEMVNAAKNSPAVLLWSIGNETPDTGLPAGPSIAQELLTAVKAVDTTRLVVMSSDQYRSVPKAGTPQDQIARILDGLGVNYNSAMSMDGLHAMYPSKPFFCSEISSETSSRGEYQDPQLLNTGQNYTPGKCVTSSYDNCMEYWAMSGEYELKKARDRLFWQGSFLWSGQDYVGEPSPYNQFPVKSSFYGPVDLSGFEKDAFHLYKSQWSAAPLVHIVPMEWTSWKPGQDVAVWVYANVATVELFLNGRSLGTKSFDRKVTTFGLPYLETTEPTNDDYNYPSGSYTSPNGSMGKLHLTWTVPFTPGTLLAIATQNGREVARDQVQTAGPPRTLTLSPDKRALTADGTSLSYVEATITDAHGVVVPHADNLIQFSVSGAATLTATDNGRQEGAASYTSSSMPAFNGRALAVVGATREPGAITLTATAEGLPRATVRLASMPPSSTGPSIAGTGGAGQRASVAAAGGAAAATATAASDATPTADASYSGAANTLPSAMLDGSLTTGWSNYYRVPETANLLAVSSSNPSDWVSLTWSSAQQIGQVNAYFTTSSTLALPASVTVTYWDGHRRVPVSNLQIDWATASNEVTTLTFDPVTTTRIGLSMTSPAPNTAAGFLQIAELQALPG
jgi:beta-galactosidase